jgi:pectin lyase
VNHLNSIAIQKPILTETNRYDNTGHAFDIGSSSSYVLAEGNVFQNVKSPLLANSGHLFGSPSTGANAACSSSLGHACVLNAFGSSGSLGGSDTSVLSRFAGKNVAGAATPNAGSIQRGAGVGVVA